MAKIMLVEDDTNLSEIYRARLEAEGYQIVSAADGEAALALAVKEKPDLIICDVMMPKISGFEMLDILRGTQGVEHTKVIMMTALSQAEDKARATALGADRYLVKSQVTLEDVVSAAKAVLGGPTPATPTPATPPPATPAPAASAPVGNITPAPAPATPAVVPTTTQPAETPVAIPTPMPALEPTAPEPSAAPANAPTPQNSIPAVDPALAQSLTSEDNAVSQQIKDFINQQPGQTAEPATPAPTEPDAPRAESPDGVSIPGKKVIQPLNDVHNKPDFDVLLAKEAAKEVEQGQAQPVVNGQEMPSTGYLGGISSTSGQNNPNDSKDGVDPNSIAL